jgi:predicted outer membrane repeat protein
MSASAPSGNGRRYDPTASAKGVTQMGKFTISSNVLRAVFGRYNGKEVKRRARLGVVRLEDRTVPTGATIHVTDPGDTIAVDGKVTLREAIDSANKNTNSNGDLIGHVFGSYGADTIVFDFTSAKTITLDNTANTTGLVISDQLTINGTSYGVTIDGAKSFRIFDTSATSYFSYLTITNGSSSTDGAGVHINGSTSVTLTYCTVSNNHATGYGGGIWASNSVLAITHSTISGNTAGGSGGGVYSEVSATMSSDTITDNYAGTGGGVCFVGGTLIMDTGTVGGNTATGYDGGGIFLDDTSGDDITTTYFDDNNSTTGNGGAISTISGSLDLTHSTMITNLATEDGGGVYGKCSVSIGDCTITSNQANNGGGVEISTSSGSLQLSGSTVIGGEKVASDGNSALTEGGGIRLVDVSTSTKSSISDAVIAENTAVEQGGGVAIVGSGNVEITDGRITSGEAGDNTTGVGIGGGLFVRDFSGDSSKVQVTGTLIGPHSISDSDGNFAQLGSNVAIENLSASVNIKDCPILNGPFDTAIGSGAHAQRGAGVYITGHKTGTVLLSGDTIANNTADIGGGVDIYDTYTAVTIYMCDVGASTIGTTDLNGNGGKVGAGIDIESATGTVTINGTTIDSNTATGTDAHQGGGGLTINQSTQVIVENSLLNGNSAAGPGGAIYFPYSVVEDKTYNMHDDTIYGNIADHGGGIFVDDYSSSGTTLLHVYNSTIAANSASFSPTDKTQKYFGGGIGFADFVSGDNVDLDSTIVATNTCKTTYNNGGEGPDIGGQGGTTGTSTGIVIENYSLIGNATNGFTLNSSSGNNQNGQNPNFDTKLRDNGGATQTLALTISSTYCIDKGSNPLGLAYDQRGATDGTFGYVHYSRVSGAAADMGAYEYYIAPGE